MTKGDEIFPTGKVGFGNGETAVTKKRRIFDLDLPEEEIGPVARESPAAAVDAPEPERDATARRGPMAAAVHENVGALRSRAAQEAAIRRENDALAAELVRLKKLGLIVDMVPIDAIDTAKLKRDRDQGPDLELAELKASIRDLGLSNPIRLEPAAQGRYELVQGLRRLTAYRELRQETKDARYAAIPAGLMAAGDTLETLYRRMVDENLVRKDVSFAEMADLARSYAADPSTECEDIDKAVTVLFQSAGYQKRSYIRAFASLLDQIGPHLKHAREIPRNLGLDLRRSIEAGGDKAVSGIVQDLQGGADRTAQEEMEILRRWAEAPIETFPTGKVARPAGMVSPRRAKVSFHLSRTEGLAKCTAANGRLEIRLPLDFSTIDRRRLEIAVRLMLESLE